MKELKRISKNLLNNKLFGILYIKDKDKCEKSNEYYFTLRFHSLYRIIPKDTYDLYYKVQCSLTFLENMNFLQIYKVPTFEDELSILYC